MLVMTQTCAYKHSNKYLTLENSGVIVSIKTQRIANNQTICAYYFNKGNKRKKAGQSVFSSMMGTI